MLSARPGPSAPSVSSSAAPLLPSCQADLRVVEIYCRALLLLGTAAPVVDEFLGAVTRVIAPPTDPQKARLAELVSETDKKVAKFNEMATKTVCDLISCHSPTSRLVRRSYFSDFETSSARWSSPKMAGQPPSSSRLKISIGSWNETASRKRCQRVSRILRRVGLWTTRNWIQSSMWNSARLNESSVLRSVLVRTYWRSVAISRAISQKRRAGGSSAFASVPGRLRSNLV